MPRQQRLWHIDADRVVGGVHLIIAADEAGLSRWSLAAELRVIQTQAGWTLTDESGRQDQFILQLTGDEALVLDAMLERFDESNPTEPPKSLTVDHPAERAVLWSLQAALEKVLVATLESDYPALLDGARRRLAHRAAV